MWENTEKTTKNQLNSPLEQENVLSISEFMSTRRYCFLIAKLTLTEEICT